MGRFVSYFIILMIFINSGLDALAGTQSHDFNNTLSTMSQLHEVCDFSIESEHNDPNSFHSAPTLIEKHDCHLGHCAYEIKTSVITTAANFTYDKYSVTATFLPEEPISYIPRPPSA